MDAYTSLTAHPIGAVPMAQSTICTGSLTVRHTTFNRDQVGFNSHPVHQWGGSPTAETTGLSPVKCRVRIPLALPYGTLSQLAEDASSNLVCSVFESLMCYHQIFIVADVNIDEVANSVENYLCV